MNGLEGELPGGSNQNAPQKEMAGAWAPAKK
jgi:hypothetical protein